MKHAKSFVGKEKNKQHQSRASREYDREERVAFGEHGESKQITMRGFLGRIITIQYDCIKIELLIFIEVDIREFVQYLEAKRKTNNSKQTKNRINLNQIENK